jgi:hypothetical protein
MRTEMSDLEVELRNLGRKIVTITSERCLANSNVEDTTSGEERHQIPHRESQPKKKGMA